MKKAFISLVFCILFAGFLFVSSRAQQPAPVNFVVFEEIVSPSDMTAFSAVQQKAVDLWKKHNFDIPIYCYGTDECTFYWVMPIENFGSLDGLFEKFSGISKKMLETDGFDGDKGFRDLSTMRTSVIHWVPELSYHPNGIPGQTSDKTYVEWSFCSLKSGHEKEAAAAIKKYIDFYNKVKEPYEWDVYAFTIGNDLPMWVLMTRAESPEAMRNQEAELNKKYSKDFEKMWNEFITHLRKIDNKTGWYKAAWSINTVR